MSRKRKDLPLLENITIEAVAAEGKSLFHHDGKVVFVPFCVPGDIVDVQIVKKRRSYCEGRVERFVELSKMRATPMCEHFGICGGCKWQNLPYEEQLKAKQNQVFDLLSRIGKIELPEFSPIMGSVKTMEYRNKLEFGCSNKRWYTKEELADDQLDLNAQDNSAIGFHITGAFDKIYPIRKCWLMDDLHNDIRNEVERYAKQIGMTFYDIREQHGMLRNLMFRTSNSGEWMLLVQFHYDTPEDEAMGQKLLQHIADTFPQITSLLYVDNQKGNDTFGDLELTTFKGSDFICEKMDDLKFKVGPKSFYQTNTEQAYHLYSVVKSYCFDADENSETPQEPPLIYDLYTGTGTIANFVAKKASKVVGIEFVPEAIEDAKTNSRINHIENTEFLAGDMKDILTEEFIQEHGRPDIIITDPPRAGMHQDVVNVILAAAPRSIVYVSCNPATQARDLALLDQDYKVVAVQPVDMFPHTPHVENVVKLVKRAQ
ncbi:23S rRNA (uracil-5-)-methyltransferase RumA [Bacteroidales bacterium KA00344]|nr:23S rRNA (uracil-5-)-methyltransferase RumA [Bacteroidales bacterium KA00344]